MAEMHRLLQLHGVESRLLKIDNRNHNSVMFKAIDSSDPVARAIVEFVTRRIELPRPGDKEKDK